MNPFGKVAPFAFILAMYSSFSFCAFASFAAWESSVLVSAGFSSCACGPPPPSALASAGFSSTLASAGFSSTLASAGFSVCGAGASLIQVPNFLASGWYASLCFVAKYLLLGAV